MNLPHTKAQDGIIIEVKVIPKSSQKAIIVGDDGIIRAKLTAPPVDGAANEQLIKLLAARFGIRKSAVVICRGETSRKKIIKLTGVTI